MLQWLKPVPTVCFSDRRSLYYMLSDSISDRTLVLLFNVPADLQSAGIEYKDFQSDYFLFLIYRYVFRIADPYILCCRIFRCAQQHVHIRQYITLVAYCPDRQNITLVALRQRYAATRPNNSGTYSKKLTDMA